MRAAASVRASESWARSRWKVSRWAVFGPMPGRRANDSIRRATGSMMGLTMGGWAYIPRQAKPTGHGGHLLLGQLAGRAEGVVDRGHDEVLEHLDIVRVDRRRVDGDADQLLLAGHGRAHDAAARRPLDQRGPRVRSGSAASPAASAVPSAGGWPSPSDVSSHRCLPTQSGATRGRLHRPTQSTSPTSASSSAKIRRASATRSSEAAGGSSRLVAMLSDAHGATEEPAEGLFEFGSLALRDILEEPLRLREPEGHDVAVDAHRPALADDRPGRRARPKRRPPPSRHGGGPGPTRARDPTRWPAGRCGPVTRRRPRWVRARRSRPRPPLGSRPVVPVEGTRLAPRRSARASGRTARSPPRVRASGWRSVARSGRGRRGRRRHRRGRLGGGAAHRRRQTRRSPPRTSRVRVGTGGRRSRRGSGRWRRAAGRR